MKRIALIPIRDFDGMTRLAPVLGPRDRHELSRRLADIAVSAVSQASMKAAVVTSDEPVSVWAGSVGVEVLPDPGGGLSRSLTTVVSALDHPHWVVLHADLPLITSDALDHLVAAADRCEYAIAPSIDGGSNVIAGTGPFQFSYGPASFHRHLAAVPHAAVITTPELAVEIDTETHLVAAGNGRLRPSLGP